MSKHCTNPNCQKEIPDNSIFCPFCGSIQASDENLLKDVLNKIDLIYRQNQEIKESIKAIALANTMAQKPEDVVEPHQASNDSHPYVDLGLSVYWSPYNLGASSEEEIGDYFAWGETEPKEEYSEDDYDYKMQKDISGDIHCDPARVKLKGGWRMPKKKEVKELLSKCKLEQCTSQEDDDVIGVRFTGPNGNSIFIPAGGFGEGDELYGQGIDLYLWTSTPDPENPTKDSWDLYINDLKSDYMEIAYSSGDYMESSRRWSGLPIRPVLDK